MLEKYIIVGRPIDEGGTKYLHSDDSIDLNAEKNGTAGTPLTVEFIGKTVVDLSQKPELGRASDEYARITNLIKHALVVRGPDGHDTSDPELEDIWENTTVALEYDERKRTAGQTDENTRTLVIPAKDTLAYREQILAAQGTKVGFEPPLTYTLDKILMKVYFNKLIKKIVTEYRDESGAQLPAATQDGLLRQVDERLGSFEEIEADAEEPIELNMVDILQSPVSAFHRAVGIYITNMCL